jgi:hypothetical protein
MEASSHTPTMLSRSYQKFLKVVDSVSDCFRRGAGRLRNARVQKLLRVRDLFIYSVEEPLLEAIDHDHAGTELT